MYYSLKNGRIATERQIIEAALIINGEEIDDSTVDSYIKNCKGVEKKVEKPNIERLVENGQLALASSIFAEQNKSVGMTIMEAKNFLKNKYGKKQ